MKKCNIIISMLSLAAVTLLLTIACKKENVTTSQKSSFENNNINGHDYYLSFKTQNDTIMVFGDVGSDITTWSYKLGDSSFVYSCNYSDDTPISITETEDSCVIINYGIGKDALIFKLSDFVTDGNNISYNLLYDDNFICSCTLYYPFDQVNAVGDAKIAPVVWGILVYVVAPIVTGVASSLIVNSCQNNNEEDARLACIRSFMELANECIKQGHSAIIRHHNNHKDCEFLCQ